MLTIREASEATGLTSKALRRRIERGSLNSTVVDGRRVLPVADLARAGLIGRGATGSNGGNGSSRSVPAPTPGNVAGSVGATELLDRLERQAVQLGELRHAALVARRLRSELESVRAELARTRARVAQLEVGKRAVV